MSKSLVLFIALNTLKKSSCPPNKSFHYISSSDISENSSAMCALEKASAGRTPVEIAEGSNLRVIAYGPDYIGATDEEAHIGQNILFRIFGLSVSL